MIIAAVLLLLLITSALLATGNGWNNVLSNTRNDLVFADRNREYGAYVIRREHHRVMIIAFLAATGVVGSLLVLPKVLSSAISEIPLPQPVPPDPWVIFDVVPPTPVPPAPRPSTPVAPRDPNDLGALIPKDSVNIVDPKDTASHDPGPVDPKGPIGPLGPTGPGDGPIVLPRDTATHESWEASSPEYPGGLDALYADLRKVIKYPQIDIDRGREGKVYLGFVVTEEGFITQVQVGRGVSPTMDAEALRAVRQLKKRWKPGKFKGTDVKVRFSLPINFHLKDN